MTEALKAAADDNSFQFFLAKLFGVPYQKEYGYGYKLVGVLWRGKQYPIKAEGPNDM